MSHREEKKETTREPFGRFSGLSIDQSLALDLRRREVGESTIDFVGADAERSCSRRRSVTDAACPLRVLIGPKAPLDCIMGSCHGTAMTEGIKALDFPPRQIIDHVGATIGRPLKASLSGEPSRGSRGFDWEGRLTRGAVWKL